MQEFKVENILIFLDDLISKSKEIQNILTNKDNLDSSEIIIKLYAEKKRTTENINILVKSKNYLKFYEDNTDIINSKVKECSKLEETNIQLLKSISGEIGNKLKELSKNKSLLVYSKEGRS